MTFRSGNIELTINTKRWFDDEQYATAWFQNLRTLAHRTPGLTISVACDQQLVEQVRQALQPKDTKGAFSPAQGYGGLLDFELDGEPVETRLPRWAAMVTTLVETTYEGSRLVIGITGGSSIRNSSTINWYGQLLPADFPGAFDFQLVVRGGTPVDPRSPTREGLINNAKLHALFDFVRERIFEFLFDTANFEHVKPEWIAAAYQLDERRALRDCPYFVASELLPITPEDLESSASINLVGDPALFMYDGEPKPLLLEPGVTVDWAGTDEAEHGLSSFLGMTGPAYRLAHGDRRRLRIGLLFWRPGGHTGEIFYDRGEWGVGYDGFAPAEWHPVTAEHVFTFSLAACWDITHVEDFLVGTADPLGFLNTLAFAGWTDDSDVSASYNELHGSYEGSVAGMIRRVIGNCVSPYFTLQDLSAFLPSKGARVETIKVIYPEGGGTAAAVAVTSTTGETVELQLLA